jgi:hypothetical protein
VRLPFLKGGCDRGDKAIHAVNPHQRDDHLRRSAAAGIDATAAQKRGHLEPRTSTDTCFRDQRFDQDRTLELFEQSASVNAEDRRQGQCNVSLSVKRTA